MYLIRNLSLILFIPQSLERTVSSSGFVQSSQSCDMDLSGDLCPGVTLAWPLFVLRSVDYPVEVTLCLASVLWSKPVFTVGFAQFREHGFSSAQRWAVKPKSMHPRWLCAHCSDLQGHPSVAASCAAASSASLWLVGFLLPKQKVTWKIWLDPRAHSELWETAGRQWVPQWWSKACWFATHTPTSPQQAWLHTPMLLWQISTVVVAD